MSRLHRKTDRISVLVTGLTWADARVMKHDLREKLECAGVPCKVLDQRLETPYSVYVFLSAHAPDADVKLRGHYFDGWLYDNNVNYPANFIEMVGYTMARYAFERHYMFEPASEAEACLR